MDETQIYFKSLLQSSSSLSSQKQDFKAQSKTEAQSFEHSQPDSNKNIGPLAHDSCKSISHSDDFERSTKKCPGKWRKCLPMSVLDDKRNEIMTNESILPLLRFSPRSLLPFIPKQCSNNICDDKDIVVPLKLESITKSMLNDMIPFASLNLAQKYYALSFSAPKVAIWKATLIHSASNTRNDLFLKNVNRDMHWTYYLPRITLSLTKDQHEDTHSIESFDTSIITIEDKSFTFRAEAWVPVSEFSISRISMDFFSDKYDFSSDWNEIGGILSCLDSKKSIGIWLSIQSLFQNNEKMNLENETKLGYMIIHHPFVYACCVCFKEKYPSISSFVLVVTNFECRLTFKVDDVNTSKQHYEERKLRWDLFDYEADIIFPSFDSCSLPKANKSLHEEQVNRLEDEEFINGYFRLFTKKTKSVLGTPIPPTTYALTNNSKESIPNTELSTKPHESADQIIKRQHKQIEIMQNRINELCSLLHEQQQNSQSQLYKTERFKGDKVDDDSKENKFIPVAIGSPQRSHARDDMISKLSSSPASFFDKKESNTKAKKERNETISVDQFTEKNLKHQNEGLFNKHCELVEGNAQVTNAKDTFLQEHDGRTSISAIEVS